MSFFEIAILIGAVILITFSLHLLTYLKGNNLLNQLLGFTFLTRGVQNLFILFLSNHQLINSPSFFAFSLVLMVLTPASIYLYIRTFVNDETKLRVKDLFHLIPGLLATVNIFPFLSASYSGKQEMIMQFIFNNDVYNQHATLLIPLLFQHIIRSILLLVYLGFAWNIVIRAQRKGKIYIHFNERIYLYVFLSASTIICISSLASSSFSIIDKINVESILLNPALTNPFGLLLIFYIIFILRYPQVLYGNLKLARIIPNHLHTQNDNQETADPIVKENANVSSLFSKEQIETLLEQIQNQMISEKPFLDPDLNIRKLAEMSNLPAHHYSYLLNQALNKNFREYLNQYRINYCISQYNEESEGYTLDYISREAGFRNRSTFIAAFKNETGLTPSKYFKRGFDSKIDNPQQLRVV